MAKPFGIPAYAQPVALPVRNSPKAPRDAAATDQQTARTMKKYALLGALALLVATVAVLFFLRSGGEIYHGSDYSVTYPENWQIIQAGPIDVAFIAPRNEANKDFRSNINIVITANNEDISTKSDTFKNIIESLNTSQNNFSLLSKGDTSINGNKCTYLQYTITSDTNRLKGSIYIVEAGKTYIFSYTAVDSEYEKYLPTFKTMLASFTRTS